MSDISKHVMNQIKDEGIKPRPRWQFILMSVLLVLCFVGAIVTGGIVMGLIMLKLFSTQWDFVSFAGEKGLPNILDVLPLIWMALLVFVLLISVWAFEHTEHGYKYKPALIMIGAILLSTALGAVLYFTQGADLVDELLQATLPPYQAMEEMMEAKFDLPERGILPGHVVVVESATAMQLEDFRDHLWHVELDQTSLVPLKHDFADLDEGMTVFVIGEKQDEDNFIAQTIRKKGLLPPPQFLRDRLHKRFMNNHPLLNLMLIPHP